MPGNPHDTGPGAARPPGSVSDALLAPMHALLRAIALVAGYALLAQAVATFIEILARKLFNYSFQGVDEIGGYVLAIVASFGFGYAAMTRSHTRVDLVLHRVAPGIRALIHLLATTILALIACGMLWYALQAFRETLAYQSIANSPLETPIWIPQSIWLAGFCVFALAGLFLVLRAAQLFARRDYQSLEHEVGTATPEEEIDALADDPGAADGPTEPRS